MKTQQKRVVIVDGYSTGRELVRKLLDRNVECLHLRSSNEPPAALARSFDPTPYDADLGYLGSPAEVIETIAPFGVDAVVAGCECGVSFAEEVAHGLGLPTNRIGTLRARRDKYQMIEAVRRQGLRVAQQAQIWSADAAHYWADWRGKWPVVIKPLDSAGSDGVSICRSHADIDRACAKVLHRENLLGQYNESALIQSYLEGPQYIVNTVSHGGRHYATDTWHMELAGAGASPLAMAALHLVDPTIPAVAQMIAYTFQVLDALGIENAAAHTELRLTADGPVLIETGARLMGAAMDQPSCCQAGLTTQAGIWAAIIAGSDEEREAILSAGHFTFRRPLSKVFFLFAREGIVTDTVGLMRLRTLPSFAAHYRALGIGARVWRTEDTLACGGTVYLVHDAREQIIKDINQFRAWEREGLLYEIESVETPAVILEAAQ